MLSLLQSLNMILIAVTPKKSLDESLEEVVLTDASHKLVISLLAMLVITVHITWIPNRNARPTNRSTSNLNFVAREQRSFVRSPRWSARVPVVARNALSSSILRFTGLSADPGQLRSSKSSMNTRSCSNPWHDVTIISRQPTECTTTMTPNSDFESIAVATKKCKLPTSNQTWQ